MEEGEGRIIEVKGGEGEEKGYEGTGMEISSLFQEMMQFVFEALLDGVQELLSEEGRWSSWK